MREMADELGFGRDNHNRYAYYETTFTKDLLPWDLASQIADVLEPRGVDRESVMALAKGLDPDVPEEGDAPRRVDPNLLDKLNLAEIPEVDIDYALGSDTLLSEYTYVSYKYFDRGWIKNATRSEPANLVFAGSHGDSMVPTILDDDAVLIDKSQTAVDRQDRIWACAYGGVGMIKRLRRVPSEDEIGRYLVISDNPAVDNYEVSESELAIIGRVVWIGRRV